MAQMFLSNITFKYISTHLYTNDADTRFVQMSEGNPPVATKAFRSSVLSQPVRVGSGFRPGKATLKSSEVGQSGQVELGFRTADGSSGWVTETRFLDLSLCLTLK